VLNIEVMVQKPGGFFDQPIIAKGVWLDHVNGQRVFGCAQRPDMEMVNGLHSRQPFQALMARPAATTPTETPVGATSRRFGCLELAQQLHAVEKAIQQAKRVLVQDHIEHCLDDAIGPLEPDQKRRVDEFKAIARYL